MKKALSFGIYIISAFILVFVAGLAAKTVFAAETDILPYACDNLNTDVNPTSFLSKAEKGYIRVFYDGKVIRIENYNDKFEITGKKAIGMNGSQMILINLR